MDADVAWEIDEETWESSIKRFQRLGADVISIIPIIRSHMKGVRLVHNVVSTLYYRFIQ